MNDPHGPPRRRGSAPAAPDLAAPPDLVEPDLAELIGRVARGDQDAFEVVYEQLSGPVYGMALRTLRDPAQAEEVAQEALVELWRKASRYEPERGSASAWALTLAHRRAIDRVRSAQAGKDREERATFPERDFDQAAEQAQIRLEQQQVRRCLERLTDLQRESITLAYYQGYSYSQVARLLNVGLSTIKTRMRDGLIRLRDCLGVDQ